jgi:hypothetical protein
MLKNGICSVISMGARRNGERDQLSSRYAWFIQTGAIVLNHGVVAWINSFIFLYSAGP